MKIAALAGGVGGAKLAQGLSAILKPEDLSIVVNTGDDFEHFCLYISPDVDTVLYTLAGISNPITGWGINQDTFLTFDRLVSLGGPDWFKLGDLDLATHLYRTESLCQGKTLTEITKSLCVKHQVRHTILPMSDGRISTWVQTKANDWLPFQEYFVKHRCEPKVKQFEFRGINTSVASKEVFDALVSADVVIICPSNPFVSIDPILSLKNLWQIIDEKFVVCVSPVINGRAIKGPLAKMFFELGLDPSPISVLKHYQGLIDCMIVDQSDIHLFEHENLSSIIIKDMDILIPDFDSRVRLAREIINFIKKKY